MLLQTKAGSSEPAVMEAAYLKILQLQAYLQSAPTPYAFPESGEESRQGNHILDLPLRAWCLMLFLDEHTMMEQEPLAD